jgi:acyl dehydratase
MPQTFNGVDEVAHAVGTQLGETEWLEITQEQVNQFAEATGDHQWIHVDVERAKKGPYGGTIAHGYLTLSLIARFGDELFKVDGVTAKLNYGVNKVRFPAPVPVGGKVRLTAHIAAADALDEHSVQLTVDFTMELAGSAKPAVAAQALYRYYAETSG